MADNTKSSLYKSPKVIFAGVLGIFLIFGLFYFLALRNVSFKTSSTNAPTGYAANIPTKIADNKVIVYYFYGNIRCSSCHKIESYTKEAYGKIKNKNLELLIVNTDKPQNQHFINDYSLYTKSVVLSKVNKGKQVKWKNLDKIWVLLGDKSKFENYIIQEIKAYLK